jgi:hypothetical protein
MLISISGTTHSDNTKLPRRFPDHICSIGIDICSIASIAYRYFASYSKRAASGDVATNHGISANVQVSEPITDYA